MTSYSGSLVFFTFTSFFSLTLCLTSYFTLCCTSCLVSLLCYTLEIRFILLVSYSYCLNSYFWQFWIVISLLPLCLAYFFLCFTSYFALCLTSQSILFHVLDFILLLSSCVSKCTVTSVRLHTSSCGRFHAFSYFWLYHFFLCLTSYFLLSLSSYFFLCLTSYFFLCLTSDFFLCLKLTTKLLPVFDFKLLPVFDLYFFLC